MSDDQRVKKRNKVPRVPGRKDRTPFSFRDLGGRGCKKISLQDHVWLNKAPQRRHKWGTWKIESVPNERVLAYAEKKWEQVAKNLGPIGPPHNRIFLVPGEKGWGSPGP